MAKKEVINKVFNSIGFVIFISILLLIKTLIFYYSTIAINETLDLETVIGTISFITIIVCLFGMLPNRARIITTMIISFLISLLLFGDHVYYIYSNSVLSVAQISNLQYGEEILSTLLVVMQLKQSLYFIDTIIIILLLLAKVLKIEKKENHIKQQLMVKYITGIIGVIIFSVIGISYIEKGRDKSYNKDLQIRESTILGYHVSDIVNALTMKQKTKYKNYETMIQDYNELKEKYETKYGQEIYPIKGILEGKNVIIIQLESIQEFVLNK